jgi:hypothetical protein
MSIGLNQLEQNVMAMLLAGDAHTLEVLREQYRVANVVEREQTGTGFFVTFAVPLGTARLDEGASLEIGDVAARIKGLQPGAGFVLFVRGGAIEWLEGYSYDEPWPPHIEEFRLSYVIVQGADWRRKSLDA